MHFEIPIAEEKVKRHQVIALHLFVSILLLVTGSLLLLLHRLLHYLPEIDRETLGYLAADKNYSILLTIIGGMVLLLVLLRSKWLLKRHNNRMVRAFEFLLLAVLAIACLMQGVKILTAIYGLLAAACAFALYWESFSSQQLYVSIDENGILLPVTKRNKRIEWKEAESLIIRHGVLTIDCLDNRLFQWNTKPTDLDPEIFEAFCEAQLEKGKTKRSKGDW